MLVADFEVFTKDWILVSIDLKTHEKKVIHNDPDELRLYYEAHKKDIWSGYNFPSYDAYILKSILSGENPKGVNDWIIEGNKGYAYNPNYKSIPLTCYDIMTVRKGLKVIEGYLGSNIYESKVDFTINRKLTPEELDETIRYCTNDVMETIRVLLLNKAEFESQSGLIKEFRLPTFYLSRTKAQLSAVILGAVKKDYFDEFDFIIPDTLILNKYTDVLDWFNHTRDYVEKLVCDIAGVEHTFAWGGLHGARPKFHAKTDDTGTIYHIDVNSYYPSIMILYNALSRSVADPKQFERIYNDRLRYKAMKDSRAAPMKIVINSTYGACKDHFNPLYDPRQANTVCVTGQLLLLDLIEKLEPYIMLIQSNTDGLIIKTPCPETVMEICEEWEKRTGMTLAKDEVSEIWQSDVNNYLMVMADGKIDSKGAFAIPGKMDYELYIVKKAVADYFIHGTPIEDTIYSCNVLMDFQKIVKIDRKTYDFGVKVENGRYIIQNENVYRVFASTNKNDGSICKAKSDWVVLGIDKKMTVRKADKFANTPEHCKIVNENVVKMPIPEWLDKEYYVNLARDLIKRVE